MKRILDTVQRGEVVVIYSRKHPIAKIVPIGKPQEAGEDYGFGMWSDYAETANVDTYLRKLRKGRRHDI